jgi:hypothetical protein
LRLELRRKCSGKSVHREASVRNVKANPFNVTNFCFL